MAKTKVNFSLSSLKMGEVGTDGGMGTTLTEFDDPVENTAVFQQAAGTDTTFPNEIKDIPFFKFTAPGEMTFEADFYAKDAAQLKRCFGGTITPGASGEPDKWSYPLETFSQEQSLEATQRNGAKVAFPRLAVQCRFEWNMRKNALPLIHLVGTVLYPLDGTTGPVIYTNAPA